MAISHRVPAMTCASTVYPGLVRWTTRSWSPLRIHLVTGEHADGETLAGRRAEGVTVTGERRVTAGRDRRRGVVGWRESVCDGVCIKALSIALGCWFAAPEQ